MNILALALVRKVCVTDEYTIHHSVNGTLQPVMYLIYVVVLY
jgi:hypothetical protein